MYSPSAEVKGHGPGQETLQLGKHDVQIASVDPVGNYAVRLVFDDGHDSGLYAWGYLYELGATHADKWQHYLDRIAKLGCRTRRQCAASRSGDRPVSPRDRACGERGIGLNGRRRLPQRPSLRTA